MTTTDTTPGAGRPPIDRGPAVDAVVGTLLVAERVDAARRLVGSGLARYPDDTGLLAAAGLLARRDGRIEDAVRHYAAVAGRDPEHADAVRLARTLDPVRASELGAVDLRDEWEPPVPSDDEPRPRPVPLVVLDDALPDAALAELRALVTTDDDGLEPAPVGRTSVVRPEVRQSLRLDTPMARGAMARCFAAVIDGLFAPVCRRLGLPDVVLTRRELRFSVYGDGAFFRCHRDRPVVADDGDPTADRLVSFACFLHTEPRTFAGGDLLIHDTDDRSDQHWDHRYTRITPVANRMVWFPSAAYHQVTAVQAPGASTYGARLVVNGHLHATV